MFNTFKSILSSDNINLKNIVLYPALVSGTSFALYSGYHSLKNSLIAKRPFFINYLVTINGLHIGFLLGAIYGATWPLSISIFANKKLIQYFDSSTTTLSN